MNQIVLTLFLFIGVFPQSFLHINSFKVDFVQKTESPFFPPIEDKGFLVVDGCKFRFEYVTNEKRITIGDCKTIYQINKDDDSVLKFSYSELRNNPFLSLLIDRDKLIENFLIQPVEGKPHNYRLIPKIQSEDMPFTVLKLKLNKGENRILKLEIIDETQQRTVYSFSNFQINFKPKKDTFSVGGIK